MLEQVFREELGPRSGVARRLSRRHRAGRRRRARSIRDRRRTLAARGRTRQPDGLADRDRSQPRDRPHPPRAHAGGEDRAAGAGAARPTGGDNERDGDVPGRAARADLHLLPPGARARRAGRAHAAHARRTLNRGDCTRLPRPVRDDEQAADPRQAQDPRRRYPVRGAARPPAARTARGRARGRLPDLQRRLGRRPRRPVGGSNPSRTVPRPSSCPTKPRRMHC